MLKTLKRSKKLNLLPRNNWKILPMRVAVAQFATSSNSQENTAICLRMIDQAAACKPDIIVLPELCHSESFYVQYDAELNLSKGGKQARCDMFAENDDCLLNIAKRATKHGCYIAISVPVKASVNQGLYIASYLISPSGELFQQNKNAYTANVENGLNSNIGDVTNVGDTRFGKLALIHADDLVSFKASRQLAKTGAQLLCQSSNTILRDNSELYGAARAKENNVFVAIANKISSYDSTAGNEDELLINSRLHDYLAKVCQSQIIAPDGSILAKMPHNQEGFIFADIDLANAGYSNKLRTDNTCVSSQLRPELYQDFAQQIKASQLSKAPETVNVAIFATYKANEYAIEDVCHYIENNLSDIIQLPELFFVSDKALTQETRQRVGVEDLCNQLIDKISATLRPFQYVCTSLIIDGTHQAVIISEHGLFARQPQLHFCQRYQWTTLADEIKIVELPLEQGAIKLAMFTADDANVPELVDVVASMGIHLLLVPFDIQSPKEVELSLLAQAAEHKFCVVAATREKSFSKALLNNNASNDEKAEKSTGFIASLPKQQNLASLLNSKKFTGYFDKPIVKQQYGKITKALIHPVLAHNMGHV